MTDTGIEFRTPVSFDIALNPSNAGAALRRLLDQGTESAVDVVVDGQPAGRWAVDIPVPDKRCLEDDFALPSALTAGTSHIRVTPAPAGGSAGTLFGLVAFSRRATAATRPPRAPADRPAETDLVDSSVEAVAAPGS